MDNGATRKEGVLSKASVPFLLAELNLALKPAKESRLRSQTVAVTGRLQQLDLGYHLKLLHGTERKSQTLDVFCQSAEHIM